MTARAEEAKTPGVGEADAVSASARPRKPFALLLMASLTLLAFAALVALGIWQVERRAWKLDLIARVDQRTHATPVAAPGPAAWPRIDAAHDEYLRVRATGHFLNDRETLVQAVTARGPGFWVLTPFVTTDGFTILVNRGFVPPERREPASRAAGEIADQLTLSGLLRLTEPGGGFLRSNDARDEHWYSRDVDAIAGARKLSGVAPYFIDADATPNPGGFPVGGLTVISFPNNHLVYALTWFSLAAMLAFVAFRVGREEWRSR